jgi:hypothetical protein
MIEVTASTDGALLAVPIVRMVGRARWEASGFYTGDVVTAARALLLENFRADESFLLLFLDTVPQGICAVMKGGIPAWWGPCTT